MIYNPQKIGGGGGGERNSDGTIPCDFNDLEWTWRARKLAFCLRFFFFFLMFPFKIIAFWRERIEHRGNIKALWEKYTEHNFSLNVVGDQCLLFVIRGFCVYVCVSF